MRNRLNRPWNGGFDLLDIGNGYFMVKFDREEDREKVINGGPWMIFDHYLAITKWRPDFVASSARIARTMVWDRFPGLNLAFYDENLLMAMGAAIGSPVKVDINTTNVERGRFARVCVEIDLSVPVVGRIWVRDHWYRVEYEGLHLICPSCGCYGHMAKNCKKKEEEDDRDREVRDKACSSVNKGQGLQANTGMEEDEIGLGMPLNIIIEPDGPGMDLHGEWLTVKRRNRVKKTSTAPKGAHLVERDHDKGNPEAGRKNVVEPTEVSNLERSNGSRFHILGNRKSKRLRQEDDEIEHSLGPETSGFFCVILIDKASLV